MVLDHRGQATSAPGRHARRTNAVRQGSLLLSLLAIGGTLAAAPAPAAAQTPQTPPVAPLAVQEQIEVIATRVPEPTHDVPVSVEVIDGDMIRAIGATNLREALSLAAGVEVAPGGDAGPAGAVPEFWGLREFDAFLLVVDDIPWGGAFNPDLTTLNVRDVERIEVLRGSAPVTSRRDVVRRRHSCRAQAEQRQAEAMHRRASAASRAAVVRSTSRCRHSARGIRAQR